MGTQLKLSRVQDYEFLGLYQPEEGSVFFYIYDMLLEDGTSSRCYYSSAYGNVLMKGDVVEYEVLENRMKVRIPRKRSAFDSNQN